MTHPVRNIILPLLVLLAAFWLLQKNAEMRRARELPPLENFLRAKNRLRLGAESDESIQIPIRAMEELDFLTKAEIYQKRGDAVSAWPRLLETRYAPTEDIFGRIEDKAPWWGIHGLYIYGDGEKSIAGPSKESRFLLNPFILVGLIESMGYRAGSKVTEGEYDPQPVDVQLRGKERLLRVRYDLQRFLRYLKTINRNTAESRVLNLTAYNARDFGFNFLWVDAKDSSGSYWFRKNTQKPQVLMEVLRRGKNCGYPDGCNNLSPEIEGMKLSLAMLPARISIKLWGTQPKNVEDDADMRVIIEVADEFGQYDLVHQKPIDPASTATAPQ